MNILEIKNLNLKNKHSPKKMLLEDIGFNLKRLNYGGEELEFSYRLNKLYPNSIVACRESVVTRINHPNYK